MTDYKVVEDKFFRYRLIFPIKNQDGSINWFNFFTGGSWGNLIKVILIVLFLCYLVWQYKYDTSVLVECCNKYYEYAKTIDLVPTINNISLNVPKG